MQGAIRRRPSPRPSWCSLPRRAPPRHAPLESRGEGARKSHAFQRAKHSCHDHARRVLSTAGRLSWIGPTLARLTLGVVFIGTGWGKLHDLDKVTGFFTELGIPAPGFNALLASSAELTCGSLLLVGLLSRLASIPLIVTMIVAILTAKRGDLHGLPDLLGFEEWTYIVLAAWITVAGPGPLSLDRCLSDSLLRREAVALRRRSPELPARRVHAARRIQTSVAQGIQFRLPR